MDETSWLTYKHILIAFYTQTSPREGETDFTDP